SVAKLLIVGSQNAVDKGFGVRKEVIAQFPGLALRANRYFAILHTVITIAVVIVAAFAILEAWGVDASAWIASTTGRRVLGSFISSAFVIAVGVVFWELVSSVIERYLARGEEGEGKLSARAKTLLPLLRNALLVVISTIVGFIVLSEIGVNIGPLLAGAGVIGLAIGFGAQTLVKDVITGIFILAEDQFRVGDVVRVNDKSGLVEQITIRTIRLRDLGGNVHMIPFNSVDMVENMTKDFSRYVFDIGIAYKEDVDEVIDILRDLGEEMQADDYYGPLINKPIEIMGLDQFADSAVIIRARLTTKPIKQWEVGREFNRRMKRKFDELGIEIPFPQQTIYFGEDGSGEAPSGYIELREGSDKKRNNTPARAARRPRTDGVDNVADDGE
ncbi:MAG: mechanosensitive ion channel domain-containing protein, partial [Pseudomonadota bacterium]|nr:mechanosensitive ion channel domain-containing protein [Pseudomonadota bacterium]